MIHWPESLGTWDILFSHSAALGGTRCGRRYWWPSRMIVCGLISLRAGGIRGRLPHWAGVLAGAVVIVLAFVWDFRNTTAGGLPNPFNWPLFLAGEAIGLSAFLAAVKISRISGISKTARFVMAAALARKREKLAGSSNSRNPASIVAERSQHHAHLLLANPLGVVALLRQRPGVALHHHRQLHRDRFADAAGSRLADERNPRDACNTGFRW